MRDILRWRLSLLLATLILVVSCGDDPDVTFTRPSEPGLTTLYDLLGGPIDRPSAFDVVAGRGLGAPLSVRIDRSGQWDIAFGVLDGQTVWLPRGFFQEIEPSSGVQTLDRAFASVNSVSDNPDDYQTLNPVSLSEGGVYSFRSRSDPAVGCRIYAKVQVLAVETDPARIDFIFLWNPNCNDTNVTVE